MLLAVKTAIQVEDPVSLSSFLHTSSLPGPPRPTPLQESSRLHLFGLYPLHFDNGFVDIPLSFFLTNSYPKQPFLCNFVDNCVSFKIPFVFRLLIVKS